MVLREKVIMSKRKNFAYDLGKEIEIKTLDNINKEN